VEKWKKSGRFERLESFFGGLLMGVEIIPARGGCPRWHLSTALPDESQF